MINNLQQKIFADFTPLSYANNLIYKISLLTVLAFIIVMPWGDGVLDGLVRLFGIIAFGIASLLFVTAGTHKKYTYYHLFLLLLWAWIIGSVMWTPNLKSGLELAPRLFQLMLLPFLFSLVIINKKSLLAAYQCYVIGNMIASSIIIYNFLHGINSPYYGRFTVKNIETDTMSIILALAIPMAAYLTSAMQGKLSKIIYTITIPYIIFAIFLTGTRTGSIVAIIGLIYWLYTHRSASIKVKLILVILFAISISAVATYAPKASIDRVFSAGKSLKSGNLNYRTVIWKASLNQWRESPIVGTGLGGLGDVLSREHVNYREAHNTHIHLLAENGIIGMAIYVLLEFSILYLILQARPFPEKFFLLALLFSIIVSQLTLHTHMQKETWFALTMLVIHSLMLQPQKAIGISKHS